MLPSYPSGIADHKRVCRQIVANPSERVTTGDDSQQSTHHILTRAMALANAKTDEVEWNVYRRCAMTQMLRQQIDIPKQQPVQVKCLAKARSDSEAEIIRPAIEREVLLTASQLAVNDRLTREEFLQFGSSRIATGDTTGRTWTHDELYDERLSHYERADSSGINR